MLGGLRAGGVLCNLNVRNAVADNIDLLNRGGCEVLFFHSSAAALAEEICAAVPSIAHRIYLDTASELGPEKIIEANALFGSVMCQSFGQTECGFPITYPPCFVIKSCCHPIMADFQCCASSCFC